MKKKIKIAFVQIIITAFSFICLNFYYHNNLFGNYYNEIDNKLCFAFNPDNSGIFIDPITNSKYYISWSYSKLSPNSLTFEFSAKNFNLPLVKKGKNNLKVPVKWPVHLLNGRGVYNLLYKKNTPWWSYKITDNYLYAIGMGEYNGLEVFKQYRTKKSLWLDIVSVSNLRNAVSTWGFIILIGFGITIMLVIVRDYFNFTMNSRPIQHSVMNRKKLTSTETSKISDTKNTQSTSTGLDELAKLSAGISLLFISMSEEEKLDFLDIFLQVEHDNPYYKNFYQRFPDYKYNPENSRDQLEILLNELVPHFGDDGKLIKFFKSIKSPMEISRLYTVYFCVKGDRVAKEKFFKHLYKLWEVEKKPPHYLYLIRYTKIKMLLHEEDYLEAGELIKQYNENLENNREFDYLPNLKQRIVELM